MKSDDESSISEYESMRKKRQLSIGFVGNEKRENVTHPKQFVEKDTQGHEVPALKPCMYAVLSCLKGSKGAHYVEMELKKLTNRKSLHQYWELFTIEIEGVCCPQLQ